MSYDQLISLKAQYVKKCAELQYVPKTPRYLPFYHIIQEKFPSFGWRFADTINHKNTAIHAPRVKNLRPSLLSLLLNKVDVSKDTFLYQKYKCIERLPDRTVAMLDAF